MNKAASTPINKKHYDEYPDTFGIEPHIYHRRWVILAVCNISLIMIVMAISSLNIAIPSIQESLNVTASGLQWILDGYALVFAGLLLLGGAIGDRYGRKGALLIGLAIFSIFSLVAVFSTSTATLVIARAFMGPGAALIMPATLSIIVVSFPIHERPKAIAIWAAFAGLGGSLGPITSGILLKHYWWGSIFFINVIVCLMLITVAYFLIPKMPTDKSHPLDPIGSFISIIALFASIYAIIEGPVKGWTSPGILITSIVGIGGIITFIIFEKKSKDPMLDPIFFKIRGFSSGSLAIAAVFFSLFGMFYLFIQYLQYVKGYEPLSAAIRLIPNSITFIVVAPLSALLVKKIKVKKRCFLDF